MTDEYIKRDAATLAVSEEQETAYHRLISGSLVTVFAFDVKKRINAIPAADVAPVRHGRWNEESPDALDGDSVYVCSVCGETWTLIEGTPLDNNMHYCPNCGAWMDGGETDD